MKYNNILLFSWLPTNDYNSRLVKMFLYFFYFSLTIFFNAVFFTYEEIEKIYEDKGSFNFGHKMPQVLYSTILSVFVLYIMKYFLLTEKIIEKFKQKIKKNNKTLEEKVKKLNKKLRIRFILFFSVTFIILFFIWFYISCFCGVYKNTQSHLMKDALLSFFITHVYTFITCLLPSYIRIKTLKAPKKNKAYIYNISQKLENI